MRSSYLGVMMDLSARKVNLPDFTRFVCGTIQKHKLLVEAVACRGISGMLVAPDVAEALDVEFAVVRKPHEDSHGFSVESATNAEHYIIVDDLISTGETMDAIVRRIGEGCVGIFLYNPESTFLEYKGIPVFNWKYECAIPAKRRKKKL